MSDMRPMTQPTGNECGCPEWVIACLHHRGGDLYLSSARRGEEIGHHNIGRWPHEFLVWEASATWTLCLCHRESVNYSHLLETVQNIADLPTALAAFHAREQAIRREVFG